MSFRVFIDGQAGTTGLQIVARLSRRDDITLINIDHAQRKNPEARAECYTQADLVILCLPDEASISAVHELANSETRILDASSAFRTHPDWAYGMPELNKVQSAQIAAANRVSNPGCYATGFILSICPLIGDGLIDANMALTAHAVSGYSGGGNQAIEIWQGSNFPTQPYALTLDHKHLPEMQCYSGSALKPLFTPSIANYRAGMIVQIPLSHANCKANFNRTKVYESWLQRYQHSPFITVHPPNDSACLKDGKLSPTGRNNTNQLDLYVFGNKEQSVLLARYDNLGKGASGAAVQNLNLMLGLCETAGLEIPHVH